MPHPTRQAIVRWAAGMLLVVVLYPLSLGPFAYIDVRGWVSEEISEPVYNYAYAPCTGLYLSGGWYTNYVDWWIGVAVTRMFRDAEQDLTN